MHHGLSEWMVIEKAAQNRQRASHQKKKKSALCARVFFNPPAYAVWRWMDCWCVCVCVCMCVCVCVCEREAEMETHRPASCGLSVSAPLSDAPRNFARITCVYVYVCMYVCMYVCI